MRLIKDFVKSLKSDQDFYEDLVFNILLLLVLLGGAIAGACMA